MYEQYQQHVKDLRCTNKYRQLHGRCQVNQDKCINFSTNDYLNLSTNHSVIEAVVVAAQEYGVGATGSRLLSGDRDCFHTIESSIAKSKGMEEAIIFSSGFQANVSALSALLSADVLGAPPLVFFDKLNHSSLYQGVFLSGAELVRYRHNDMVHLEVLLKQHKNDHRHKFIIAETLFGMDGDVLPIHDVAELAKQHHAILYLDEAHATGILGPLGYGLSTAIDLDGLHCIVMGTFSKALGCSGSYIACSKTIKEYLINKATGFVYSTAPSPAIMCGALKAWRMLPEMVNERSQLQHLSSILRSKLSKSNFDIGASVTHIVPIIVGEERVAIDMMNNLMNNNLIVSCVRPPTVPPGTSRLRIALCSHHQEKDLDLLVSTLERI
ncbi:8-amino-7-oxononanoate synthase [Rickettsiales endosymbiont of Peranema trichophorum]|nr:8-amino-7-oxononanoate synthase [Rickettsiales endosymbiont of Peranema trichophorum]